jgi:hypothetical protein
LNTDDGGLVIAPAPTAKPIGIIEPPIENILGGQVIVLNLDLHDALRNLEWRKSRGTPPMAYSSKTDAPSHWAH